MSENQPTLTLSQLIAALTNLQFKFGDIPVVLYDLDTSGYFRMTGANIELQLMPDESLRVSMGVNDFQDPGEPDPKKRPLAGIESPPGHDNPQTHPIRLLVPMPQPGGMGYVEYNEHCQTLKDPREIPLLFDKLFGKRKDEGNA